MLVLRKQTQPVPLLVARSGQIDVPLTGQPTSIELPLDGKPKANCRVASWLGDGSQRPFDWRYRLSIASSGLIERKGRGLVKEAYAGHFVAILPIPHGSGARPIFGALAPSV